MAVMSYIDAITFAMREEMERDERFSFLEKMLVEKAAYLKRRMVYMINLVNTVY